MRVLPRRAVSRASGFLANARMPRWMLRPFLATYAKAFRVDLSEAGWATEPETLEVFAGRAQ